MRIENFEELNCWKSAREFANRINMLAKKSKFEDIGLERQLRNSSGSAMDNIAEGFERRGNKEFIQFLHISIGSLNESKSQLYRAFDNQYISEQELKEACCLLETTLNTVAGLANYLKNSEIKGIKYK